MDNETKTIRGLIDKMALVCSEAPFLISPETGRVLTFRGLQEQSALLSSRLRQAGLEHGDKVAFLMDNGLLTAQIFLGAMYGGFISVPLNVRAGVSQLTYTLDHCDAKVVFVGAQYEDLIKQIIAGVRRPVQVVPAETDNITPPSETPSATISLAAPAPDDVALLMYTSGSTGQPKAAVHSHRSVLAGARNSVASHQLTSADRSLLLLPLYHINAECVTLIPTLLSGGSVVVPHHFNVSEFWDLLQEHRCTWSALVPTIISQLLGWKDPREESRRVASQRIRFLRSSSAPLSPSLHREFLDKFKLLLIQAMGSTEAGNIFSNPLPPGANKIGSPGLPWGFETRIVNREGLEVPPGEPGEVLIRGPALMQGYYKDPEGTMAVLGHDGWFHTGDLAYRDNDGYFFVVGRSKELIIKGGMNIAPKQIDEVLESHPAVLQAAAVGVPDRYLGEEIVAFAVLRAAACCEEKELLAFCEDRLGHFKTPTRVHFLKDLPKGPSGKVQRLRLVQAAAHPAVLGFASSQPELGERDTQSPNAKSGSLRAGSFEELVAETWSESLGQSQLNAHDNFFSLGGYSLLAIRCLSRLREKFSIALSLSDFFKNPTIAQQAALLERHLANHEAAAGRRTVKRAEGKSPEKASSPAPEPTHFIGGIAAPTAGVIPARNRSLPCPLSPAQERVWFLEQLDPGPPVYNEAEAVRLRGELDEEAMERALNLIIERHEILRTTIQAKEGRPEAIVHQNWSLKLKKFDLRRLPVERREAEVRRLLIEEPRRLYRLEAEPGIRATLIRLAAGEHALILMMHHMICDRMSIGILWRELGTLYDSCARGEPSPLKPLPIQYGDYASWQKQQLQQANIQQDVAFWKHTLREAPKMLDLSTDRPRPSVISYRGDKRRFRLGPELARSVRDLGCREKTSLFNLFAAALNTLLYRYTGQEDILIGIPIADRERPELQPLIGFFIDTQVLRTRISHNLTFRELLARVQQGVVDVYSHQALPFAQVVQAVSPERNLSYSPLFQVMLNWRDRDAQLQFIGLSHFAVEPLFAQSKTSKFDLTLFLTDAPDDILLEMEYNTDLFDDARIDRLAAHLRTLLDAVVRHPEQRLAELPLLTDAERQQLLLDWNRTQMDYSSDQCLHHLIEAQVSRAPEALAIAFEDQQLTYRELNRQANRLAHHLQKLGVGPDVLVGLCVERSAAMVVGLLGVLKAGAAYVPLDPGFPKERLSFILEDAQARVLITQRNLLVSLPDFQGPVVYLEELEGSAQSQENPSSSVGPHNLAYVIFTSGSTGRPKGVQIEHRSVVNFLQSVAREPGLTASDILLAVTTVSFDIAGLELFLPLLKGARVVVASREVVGDGRRLGHLMDRCGATILQATPATLRMLLGSGWTGRKGMKILCGGEALAPELATELIGRCRSLWNMYGPTETTIWSTLAQVQLTEGPITIGRPIANTQVYLLDRHGQPVPVGVVGELHIGGVGVARGYLNREELTREKFVPNPFCHEPGARMYRTGDLGKYRPDGQLEWLGRIDHQVKLRGFRVELGEIESILLGHPAVREAVVVVREDGPGGNRLVAYLTAKDGRSPDVSELRNLVRGKLPDYMVPSAFVALDKLPLTPNGKVDRKALPSAGGPEVDVERGWAPPEDEAEESIARVWAEVLGVDRVGRDSNFFDLGGHSLLLISARRKLEEVFAREVPVVEMFRHSTVRSLAKYLTGTEVAPAGWSDSRARLRVDKGSRQRHRELRQRLREQLTVH